MTTLAAFLTDQIRVVCPPIVGISLGIKTDKTTWRIDFDSAATPTQRTAAQSVIDNFDLSTIPAIEALPDPSDFQNAIKLFKAKCISDLAFRLGVAPGALTSTQISAERARIKAIADALP